MTELLGNSILIIDQDPSFCYTLRKKIAAESGEAQVALDLASAKLALRKRDFDFVICNYYLHDGLIHQLVDWCKKHCDTVPMFVALGTPPVQDKSLLQRHMIVDFWAKSYSVDELVAILVKHTFDPAKFKTDFLEGLSSNPRGIVGELVVEREKLDIKPLEIFGNGVYVSSEVEIKEGSCGILSLTLLHKNSINFKVMGFSGVETPNGIAFTVHDGYLATWEKLLAKLSEEQISINKFMKKAAGF